MFVHENMKLSKFNTTPSKKINLKSITFFLFTSHPKTKLIKLFWAQITALGVFCRFLKEILKKKELSSTKKEKFFHKEEMFTLNSKKKRKVNKVKEILPENICDSGKISWLNGIKDWDKTDSKNNFDIKNPLSRISFNSQKKSEPGKSDWFSKNRIHFSKLRKNFPQTLKWNKTKFINIRKKRLTQKQNFIVGINFFKIKIYKLHLFSLNPEKNLSNPPLHRFTKASEKKFLNFFCPSPSKFEKMSKSKETKEKSGNSIDSYKNSFSFVLEKYFFKNNSNSVKNGKDKDSSTIPKIMKNIKKKKILKTFKLFPKTERSVLLKFESLLKEKVILKQFNPYGDIFFFLKNFVKEKNNLLD